MSLNPLAPDTPTHLTSLLLHDVTIKPYLLDPIALINNGHIGARDFFLLSYWVSKGYPSKVVLLFFTKYIYQVFFQLPLPQ